MDLFEVSSQLSEEKLHPKFKWLRDSLFEEIKIVEEWAKDFIDKDNKFIHEFQTTFHSSFWELYLHKVFLNVYLYIFLFFCFANSLFKSSIELNDPLVNSSVILASLYIL